MRSLTKALLLLSAGAVACTPRADESVDSAATAAAPAATTPTLHERLGGTAAISTVIDSFVANVAADSRINRHFQRIAGDTAAVRGFKTKLVDQICQATGGPCTYTGLDMKSAHQGMNLTDADFDALVEDLVKALDSAGVSQRDKDELLGILGPMRAEIVTRR